MKIKFRYPHRTSKDEKIIELIVIKCNPKFVHEFSFRDFDWVLCNHLKSRSVFMVGSYKGGAKYWCTSLSHDSIYKSLPMLKANIHKFNKRGFHKRILESLLKKMQLEEVIKAISKDNWEQYIATHFKE